MSKAENLKHAHAYILFIAIFIISSHGQIWWRHKDWGTSWGQTDGNPETDTHERVASCQLRVRGIGMEKLHRS